jgi:hypothetical protein
MHTIITQDEFTNALWFRVQEHLAVGLTALELTTLSKVSAAEIALKIHTY